MSRPFFLSRFLLFERECNSFARDTAIKREPPPPLWNNKFLETKRQLFKWHCQCVRPYVTVSTISNFCSTTEEVFYGKLESEIDLHRLLCLFFRKLYIHGILFLGKSEEINFKNWKTTTWSFSFSNEFLYIKLFHTTATATRALSSSAEKNLLLVLTSALLG